METQNVAILNRTDSGMKVSEVCRKHGISDATYYNWKAKYGGMLASELKRLEEMKAELAELKLMYADRALENRVMKGLIEKKALRPSEKREMAQYLIERHQLSKARSYRRVGLARGALYRSLVDWTQRDAPVVSDLNGLLEELPRSGFWKYAGTLSRRDYPWNHKRIYRVYGDLGLNQPRRKK